MSRGDLYDPGDPDLVARNTRAQHLCADFNRTRRGDPGRAAILRVLLGTLGDGAVIRPPFHCDYGTNLHLGPGAFLNHGCIVLDICAVCIGAGTQIGPMCQLLAADHPRDAAVRAQGLEFGQPITIGRNVWIGGGALILPGVSIGDGAIVGAGAVVTRSVAPGVTVAGNPARPLR